MRRACSRGPACASDRTPALTKPTRSMRNTFLTMPQATERIMTGRDSSKLPRNFSGSHCKNSDCPLLCMPQQGDCCSETDQRPSPLKQVRPQSAARQDVTAGAATDILANTIWWALDVMNLLHVVTHMVEHREAKHRAVGAGDEVSFGRPARCHDTGGCYCRYATRQA